MASRYETEGNQPDFAVKISDMRAAYLSKQNVLKESELAKNPFKMFDEWFQEARKCTNIEEANAMCLATSTPDGFPSARYVLMKDFNANGFTFFTNYNSRKGREMEKNPNVAAVFYWEPLKRSIRIEGSVCKVPADHSSAYFHSRPKESQLGACVSNQSSVIANRNVLEDELTKLKIIHENIEVSRPEHWGGYIIEPRRIEFWQGQNDRLHDRILFRRIINNEKPDEVLTHFACEGWIYERLSP